jgi:hypothetical protein
MDVSMMIEDIPLLSPFKLSRYMSFSSSFFMQIKLALRKETSQKAFLTDKGIDNRARQLSTPKAH